LEFHEIVLIQQSGLELAGKGFNPDWEPNEYGLKLEALIDKLADLYLWPEK
jgi:hypothetical protein